MDALKKYRISDAAGGAPADASADVSADASAAPAAAESAPAAEAPPRQSAEAAPQAQDAVRRASLASASSSGSASERAALVRSESGRSTPARAAADAPADAHAHGDAHADAEESAHAHADADASADASGYATPAALSQSHGHGLEHEQEHGQGPASARMSYASCLSASAGGAASPSAPAASPSTAAAPSAAAAGTTATSAPQMAMHLPSPTRGAAQRSSAMTGASTLPRSSLGHYAAYADADGDADALGDTDADADDELDEKGSASEKARATGKEARDLERGSSGAEDNDEPDHERPAPRGRSQSRGGGGLLAQRYHRVGASASMPAHRIGASVRALRAKRPRACALAAAALAALLVLAVILAGVLGARAARRARQDAADAGVPAVGSPLVAGLIAPQGFTHEWDALRLRTSWESDAPYLTRLTLGSGSGSGSAAVRSVTQAAVSQCAAACEAPSLGDIDGELPCNAFQLVQFPAHSNEGDVVCALYTAPIAQASATQSAGLAGWAALGVGGGSGGNGSGQDAAAGSGSGDGATSGQGTYEPAPLVVASYTFQRAVLTAAAAPANATAPHGTSSSNSTGTSSSNSTTIAASRAPGVVTLPTRNTPPPPAGAALVQFQPCPSATNATVPLFVSSLFAGAGGVSSGATSAVIIQHGIGRDFNNAWKGIYPQVDVGSTLLLAPNFYLPSDSPRLTPAGAFSNWYDPAHNLAWDSFEGWVGGADPVAPGTSASAASSSAAYAGAGAACSTYDVYDALRTVLLNATAYPSLRALYVTGHSGGGAFVSRYALLADDAPPGLAVRYVHANAPSFPYATPARPGNFGQPGYGACSDFNQWMYGTAGGLFRYAQRKFTNTQDMFARYFARDVVALQGDLDTRSRYPVGDYSCEVLAQGGNNRRDRNYAWWAYKVLLAGAPIDVSAFLGASVLRPLVQSLGIVPAAAAAAAAGGTGATDNAGFGGQYFNHRMCIVPNVGHIDGPMWGSACGKSSLAPEGPQPGVSAPPLTP